MFTKDMSVMLVLKDVTMKPKIISLSAETSAKFLETVLSAYTPQTAHYCFKIALGKDVVYHDLEGTGVVSVYGQVGNLNYINASYDQKDKATMHTVAVYPTAGQAFKPLNTFLDKLKPWDTIQTFGRGGHIGSVNIKNVSSEGVWSDSKSGLEKDVLARIISRRNGADGYPKGNEYPNNYLGLSEPLNTQPYRMGKAIYKNYMCQCCGNIQEISTNHEGSCWAYCNSCSWKPTAYGKLFYLERNRPFITAQLANIILEQGLEKALVYYEYLTTENEREPIQ